MEDFNHTDAERDLALIFRFLYLEKTAFEVREGLAMFVVN
eukprot:SAG11_NODE_1539_length_4722_cov_4.377028_2_plen_40_part_00